MNIRLSGEESAWSILRSNCYLYWENICSTYWINYFLSIQNIGKLGVFIMSNSMFCWCCFLWWSYSLTSFLWSSSFCLLKNLFHEAWEIPALSGSGTLDGVMALIRAELFNLESSIFESFGGPPASPSALFWWGYDSLGGIYSVILLYWGTGSSNFGCYLKRSLRLYFRSSKLTFLFAPMIGLSTYVRCLKGLNGVKSTTSPSLS